LTVLATIWLIGVTLMVLHGLASYFILKRRMRSARRLGANVFEAGGVQSPFVLGILSPKVFISPGMSAADREHCIDHELMHIRRHDNLSRIIAYSILCLHWFNPLVWLAYRLMGDDMEMSCDERVLRQAGRWQKRQYSKLLVAQATASPSIITSPLAFGSGNAEGASRISCCPDRRVG
jgi:beta-lactamase regulating signal transducer with metallopeptidase domain